MGARAGRWVFGQVCCLVVDWAMKVNCTFCMNWRAFELAGSASVGKAGLHLQLFARACQLPSPSSRLPSPSCSSAVPQQTCLCCAV